MANEIKKPEEMPQFELIKELPGKAVGTKLRAYASIIDFNGLKTVQYYMYENYKQDSNTDYSFTYHFMMDHPEWFKRL